MQFLWQTVWNSIPPLLRRAFSDSTSVQGWIGGLGIIGAIFILTSCVLFTSQLRLLQYFQKFFSSTCNQWGVNNSAMHKMASRRLCYVLNPYIAKDKRRSYIKLIARLGRSWIACGGLSTHILPDACPCVNNQDISIILIRKNKLSPPQSFRRPIVQASGRPSHNSSPNTFPAEDGRKLNRLSEKRNHNLYLRQWTFILFGEVWCGQKFHCHLWITFRVFAFYREFVIVSVSQTTVIKVNPRLFSMFELFEIIYNYCHTVDSWWKNNCKIISLRVLLADQHKTTPAAIR